MSNVNSQGPLLVTEDLIHKFLEAQEARGLSEFTMLCYRRRIAMLYRDLPADMCIRENTLSEWRDAMCENGVSRVNIMGAMVTANKLVEFCGREDLMSSLHKDGTSHLSREDYCHLLDVARTLRKWRGYLIVRAFGLMGLETRQLALLTIEAARKGEIIVDGKVVPIPESFRAELLRYADKQGIADGQILLNQRRIPLHRSNVSCEVKSLCHAAGLPESDGYPKQIRALYSKTKKEVVEDLEPLVSLVVEQLLSVDDGIDGDRFDEEKFGALVEGYVKQFLIASGRAAESEVDQ